MPSFSSSSMAASHWFWCMVSRAIRKESILRTPGSSVSSYRRHTCSRPWLSAVTLKRKSAIRLPLLMMYRLLQWFPAESLGSAPIPPTMTCCGFIPARITSSILLPPRMAPTREFRAASSWSSTGEVSSSRAIMVASISQCAISSVPMSRIMSRYLAGARQFHPWNRYPIITLISPHCPPSTSCSCFAKMGSGFCGRASNCSSLIR
jgi:hypothetical protein